MQKIPALAICEADHNTYDEATKVEIRRALRVNLNLKHSKLWCAACCMVEGHEWEWGFVCGACLRGDGAEEGCCGTVVQTLCAVAP